MGIENNYLIIEDDTDKLTEEEFDSEVVTDNESTSKEVLPDPTLSNIESIISILENTQYMRDKERISKYILIEVKKKKNK